MQWGMEVYGSVQISVTKVHQLAPMLLAAYYLPVTFRQPGLVARLSLLSQVMFDAVPPPPLSLSSSTHDGTISYFTRMFFSSHHMSIQLLKTPFLYFFGYLSQCFVYYQCLICRSYHNTTSYILFL